MWHILKPSSITHTSTLQSSNPIGKSRIQAPSPQHAMWLGCGSATRPPPPSSCSSAPNLLATTDSYGVTGSWSLKPVTASARWRQGRGGGDRDNLQQTLLGHDYCCCCTTILLLYPQYFFPRSTCRFSAVIPLLRKLEINACKNNK